MERRAANRCRLSIYSACGTPSAITVPPAANRHSALVVSSPFIPMGPQSAAAKKAAKSGAATGRNWRCEGCGNTDNKSHWHYCSRPTCLKPWKQPQQQQQQQQQQGYKGWDKWQSYDNWGYVGKGWGGGWCSDSANDTNDELQRKLREARNSLGIFVEKLPEGHPTIQEYATLVRKLEQEQESSVSTEDRLRVVLSDATKCKANKDWADADVGKAVVVVREATKALKEKMLVAESATAAFNANTLEIAELTRPAASGQSTPVVVECPIQAFRAQIDRVDPGLLVQHGATGEKLAEFFRFFSNVSAVVQHAAPPAEVAPAPDVTVAPAVHVAPAPVAPTPALVPAHTPTPPGTTTIEIVGFEAPASTPPPGQPDAEPMGVDETGSDFSADEKKEESAEDALDDALAALGSAGSTTDPSKDVKAVPVKAGGSSG